MTSEIMFSFQKANKNLKEIYKEVSQKMEKIHLINKARIIKW